MTWVETRRARASAVRRCSGSAASDFTHTLKTTKRVTKHKTSQVTKRVKSRASPPRDRYSPPPAGRSPTDPDVPGRPLPTPSPCEVSEVAVANSVEGDDGVPLPRPESPNPPQEPGPGPPTPAVRDAPVVASPILPPDDVAGLAPPLAEETLPVDGRKPPPAPPAAPCPPAVASADLPRGGDRVLRFARSRRASLVSFPCSVPLTPSAVMS